MIEQKTIVIPHLKVADDIISVICAYDAEQQNQMLSKIQSGLLKHRTEMVEAHKKNTDILVNSLTALHKIANI